MSSRTTQTVRDLDAVLALLEAELASGRPVQGAASARERMPDETGGRVQSVILAGLSNGEPLSTVLGGMKRLPPFIATVIRHGENSGTLLHSLRAVRRFLPLANSYQYHVQKIKGYLVTLLAVLFAFTAVSFSLIRSIYRTAQPEALREASALSLLSVKAYLVMANPLVILGIALVLAHLLGRRRRRLASTYGEAVLSVVRSLWIPYVRFQSLEVVSAYALAVESGIPPVSAVELAADCSRSVSFRRILRTCADAMRNGASLRDLLKKEPLLKGSPIDRILASPMGSSRMKHYVADMNDFLHGYVRANIEKDMTNMLAMATAIMGVVVAGALALAFNALLATYQLI